MKSDGENGNAPRSPLDRQDLKGIAPRRHGLGTHQYTLAASMECAVAAAMAKGGDTSDFNNFAAFGGSGAARFFSEVREFFISPTFETGNTDPIEAYADLLSSGDERSEAAARSWAEWGGNSFNSSS